MKILSILTYYHPHWTGLTAHAQRLAAGLARRGHAVTVLAHQHTPSLPRREMHDGVNVERVPPMTRVSRGMVSPTFPLAAARLLRGADVVLINTPMFEALPVALLCRLFRRPLVMVHHGDLIMPNSIAERTVEHATVASMRAAGHLADRVTTYSDDYGQHSDFLLPFRPKLVAIPPPVEMPTPDPAPAAAWRRRLGLEGKKVIGFAGRFVEEKGGDILLRALPAVLAAEPDAHLVFAGDTNVVYERFFAQCAALLEPVADHVTLLGLVLDRHRLAEFYRMCDVLALPSRTDCFALVQAEAMLCGTPVVATNIPGAREAVRRTGMGMLVPPENPPALAAGLLAVLRTPAQYERPHADIARTFDPTLGLDAYEELLQSLIHRPAPRRLPSYATGEAPPRMHPVRAALDAADEAQLALVLRNESDMAYRRRLPILLDYLALRDGERVLDAGCGMGFGLQVMATLRRLSLTGVDRDRARLAWARREGLRAALLAGDVGHLPFATASFDKILLSEVLEHVEDDAAALRDVFRILRPGGTVAISVPHANYPLLWDPINRVWAALGGRPLRDGPLVGIWSLHRRLYWPEDLTRRVVAAGFTVERMDMTTHYAVPFAHFLVYGIGKPLIERGLLPERWRNRVDRTRGAVNPGGPLDPFSLARRVFLAVDRLNDRPATARKRTFVSILLQATKPAA